MGPSNKRSRYTLFAFIAITGTFCLGMPAEEVLKQEMENSQNMGQTRSPINKSTNAKAIPARDVTSLLPTSLVRSDAINPVKKMFSRRRRSNGKTGKPFFRFTRPDEIEFELENDEQRQIFANLLALLSTVKEPKSEVDNAPTIYVPGEEYFDDYEDEPLDLGYYGGPTDLYKSAPSVPIIPKNEAPIKPLVPVVMRTENNAKEDGWWDEPLSLHKHMIKVKRNNGPIALSPNRNVLSGKLTGRRHYIIDGQPGEFAPIFRPMKFPILRRRRSLGIRNRF